MKQKFINSISLVAVCAVLSGCGDSNIKKNLEQLKAEIEHNGAMLAARASQVTRDASDRGVPLPGQLKTALSKDMIVQADDIDSHKEAAAVISREAERLTALAEGQRLGFESIEPLRKALQNQLRTLGRVYAEQAREAKEQRDSKKAQLNDRIEALQTQLINMRLQQKATERQLSTVNDLLGKAQSSLDAGTQVNRQSEEDLLSIIYTSASVEVESQGAPAHPLDEILARDDVPVEVREPIIDFFAKLEPVLRESAEAEKIDIGVAADLATAETNLGDPVNLTSSKPSEVTVVLGGHSEPGAETTLHTQVNIPDFRNVIADVVRQYHAVGTQTPAAPEEGSLVTTNPTNTAPIAPHEALGAAADAILRITAVTGGTVGIGASEEQRAALLRIAALGTLRQSDEFQKLSPREQTILAAYADAYAGVGSPEDLGVRLIAVLQFYSATAGQVLEGDALANIMTGLGITDPEVATFTSRAFRTLQRSLLMTGTQRAAFFRAVAALVPLELNDGDFSRVLSILTLTPEALESGDLTVLDGLGISSDRLAIAARNVRQLTDAAVGTDDPMMVAVQQANTLIAEGRHADGVTQVVARSLGEWRLAARAGSPKPTVAVEMPDDPRVLTLANVVTQLPSNDQLAIFTTANDAALAAIRTAEESLSESGNMPQRPTITQNVQDFTKAYQDLTKFQRIPRALIQDTVDTSAVHKYALTILQSNISKITAKTVGVDPTKFREFPTTVKMPYLASLCHLKAPTIRLLYTMNETDQQKMPALILTLLETGVIDAEGKTTVEPLANVLGYYADMPASTVSDKIRAAAVKAWQTVGSLSNGKLGSTPILLRQLKEIDPAVYQKVLLELAKQFDQYFTTMREEAIQKPEKDRLAALEKALDDGYTKLLKGRVALKNALQRQLDEKLKGIIGLDYDRAIELDDKALAEIIKNNKKAILSGDKDAISKALIDVIRESKTRNKTTSALTLNSYLETIPGLATKNPEEKSQLIALIKSALQDAVEYVLLSNDDIKKFFDGSFYRSSTSASRVEEVVELSAELSASTFKDISDKVSLRKARTAANGAVDGRGFKLNGSSGQSVELGLPLFVQLKGEVSSAKATDAVTGAVAYRLGNTVIGAIQGYANAGDGFGIDGRLLETSVVASQSFGSFFVEGQIGSVSASDVHLSDWSGYRSQITVGLDTAFVSPFVQVAHRQLDRGGMFNLNETIAYVGLDMDISKLAMDTYSIDTRLLAKAGYGSKGWTSGVKDFGSTTGFSGSVEWSASLNLNSGVAFSSSLTLDTETGSAAGLTVSLDR